MAFNGSGTFLINTAGQPVVSGTVISSTAFNALTADLATGLSTVITKDGQTTVTANIPMSTYKFTGLGVGSAATDSANLSQVQSTVTKLLTSVSGADTITAVGAPVVAAYAAGQMFYFVATGDNTGAVTLNIDSLGAKAVTRDGSVALAAGDIKSGEVVVVVYDGTRFQVVSQLNSAGDARFANVSIASSLYVGGVSTFVGNAGFSANVSIASALSVGGVAAITGATTIGGNLTLNGGTANGVLYLNGSKVATSGSALTYDGTTLVAKTATGGKLTLDSTTTGTENTITGLLNNGNAYANINYVALDHVFKYGTTELARFTSSGNLGIGTSAPSSRLEVLNGGDSIVTITGNTASGNFASVDFKRNTGTVNAAVRSQSVGGNDIGEMYFMTRPSAGSLTERMRLDSSGNLGIGTTTVVSGCKLNVSGGINSTNGALNVSGNGGFYNAANKFGVDNYVGASRFYSSGANSSTKGSYEFHITDSVGTLDTIAMTLDASGNLGIGTSSPANKFVVSNGGALGFEFVPASGLLQSFNRSTSAYGTFICDGSDFIWRPSGTERMRLDSSGNLGIGTSSPGARLDVVTGTARWRITNDGSGNIVNEVLDSTGAAYRDYKLYGLNLISYTSGTERMRLDTSGNLGIGTTSPAERLHVVSGANTTQIRFGDNTNCNGYLGSRTGNLATLHTDQTLAFGTGNATFTERARITSGGKLLVGTTTAGYGLFTTQRVTINPDSDGIVVAPLSQNLSAYTVQANNDTGTRYAMYIANGSSTAVGTVSFTSTATAYNTSSDYRLKNTIAPMTGALAKVALLKPCTYKWNADGSDGQGFIAHELAEVVPQCVTGEKDAVDAEGKPRYQGVDTSFLVATLTAAIQELTARVAQLETK